MNRRLCLAQGLVPARRTGRSDAGTPIGKIGDGDGDGVVFFNFRGDRAIETSCALEDPDFDVFDRTGVDGRSHPDVSSAGMLQYDGVHSCRSSTSRHRRRPIA